MADVFYNNTSAIFHNDTFAETEHDDHEADEHCHNYPSTKEIYFYVNVIVLLIIITLGLIGNSIVVAVHSLDPTKNSNTILLRALAILDNILLLDGLFSKVLYSAFPYTGIGHWFWDHKDYLIVISEPIAHWAHSCSTWCVVLVTIDRYIVVSRPLRATKLCTIRRAKISLLIMVSISTLYNIPRAFEFTVQEATDPCSNDTIWKKERTILMNNPFYQLGYTVILYFITMYILPLGILLSMNMLLIKHVKKATHNRHSLTSHKPKPLRRTSSTRLIVSEEGITRTVMCIIIRFIVCTTPGLALRILIITNAPVTHTYEIFSSLLVYINSSTNFIIFAVMGERFRKVMMTKLCKTKKRQRKAARLASMASLELIRSITELTLKTTSTAATNNLGSNDNRDITTRLDYSRLRLINNVINSKMKGMRGARSSLNKLMRRHSWTLDTEGDENETTLGGDNSEENYFVQLRSAPLRRGSEPW